MINISPHITYTEATHSDTAKKLGILNIPNDIQLASMQELATRIFEPIRDHFGVPIYIPSFFRSSALNKAVGGAKNSQHMLGEAMDIDSELFGQVTNKQIFDYIKANLVFDQLIWEAGTDEEPDWVHVSYRKDNNRGEVLQMKRINNKPTYTKYI